MLQLENKNKIYIYFFFFLILSTITNYNFSNFFIKKFKIKQIHVFGLNNEQNNKIKYEIKKLNYKNIFLLNKNEVKKIIEDNNLVEKYKVKLKYPDIVIVDISKTTFIGKVYSLDEKYLIGSNGKKIKVSDFNSTDNIPIVSGDIVINEYIKFVKKIQKSNLKLKDIERLHYHKIKRWDIKTKNGFLIMLPQENIHKKLSIAYKLILNNIPKDFNRIDLRIKNKVTISYE